VARSQDNLTAIIKKLRMSSDNKTVLSNRLVIKNEQGIVLMGFKSESNVPLFANEQGLFSTFNTKYVFDRTTIDESDYFYKRKYTTNSNAKNF
jgi:outer membrane receptor for Fe3+-dicitrate